MPPIEHVAANLADPEANPTGAKGIGEPPLVPTIANAIFDAVGVRLRPSAPWSATRPTTVASPTPPRWRWPARSRCRTTGTK